MNRNSSRLIVNQWNYCFHEGQLFYWLPTGICRKLTRTTNGYFHHIHTDYREMLGIRGMTENINRDYKVTFGEWMIVILYLRNDTFNCRRKILTMQNILMNYCSVYGCYIIIFCSLFSIPKETSIFEIFIEIWYIRRTHFWVNFDNHSRFFFLFSFYF